MCKYAIVGLAAALVGSTTFASTAALAEASPPLPTCTTASLGAAVSGIVPTTFPGTIAQGIPAGSRSAAVPFVSIIPTAPPTAAHPPGQPTKFLPTPVYCQVAFVYASGLSGPADGYAVGQTQQIQILVFLPLNSVDVGSYPGFNVSWNGGVMVSGSAGSSGSLGGTELEEGLNAAGGPATGYDYVIRNGYVGSSTDTGQIAASAAHALVLDTNVTPNVLTPGTIADWAYRGTHYGKQWADAIATLYHARAPTRHYYNGASGGGNMGMGQLMHYGDEYDGFLIGGPVFYYTQGWQLPSIWPNLVFRKLVQLGGALPTTAQAGAVFASAVAACDVIAGLDTVADGIIADPRWCNFDAKANVCGAAGAPPSPNCLTQDQALAFNRIWDGPRNSKGARIWYPYDVNVPLGQPNFPFTPSIRTSVTSSAITWDHLDGSFPANNCVFIDQESLALGTTNAAGAWSVCAAPYAPITYEDEATLNANTVADYTDNQTTDLTQAMKHGAKVIHFDGNADGTAIWNNGPDFYNRVATTMYGGTTPADYAKLQEWYRLFTAPGVGHVTGAAGGGVGPSPYDPFIVLRNWVEHGVVPTFIPALAAGNALSPGRTRPLCPYPQTSNYSGAGSTDDSANFTCGGNVQTLPVACNDVRTVYKQENTAILDFEGVGLTAEECVGSL